MKHPISYDNLLLVQVEESWREPKIVDEEFTASGKGLRFEVTKGCAISPLPPGQWEIVGLYPGMTEEEAAKCVNSREWYFPERHTQYYNYSAKEKDIPNEQFKQRWNVGFITALRSLESLFEAAGALLVNPYGDKEPEYKYVFDENYSEDEDFAFNAMANRHAVLKWKEAEYRTSKKWLALRKYGI